MKSFAPTTPSRRHMTVSDYRGLTRTRPLKSRLMHLQARSGRNSQGRITMRHQGGGHKKLYRIIDFKQMKMDVPAKVESLEYDPYRTTFIARIVYKDGARAYILAPKDLKVGDEIITGEAAPFRTGNRMKLKNIPVGYQVHNIELTPLKGGQLAKSAGSYAEVLANAAGYTDLKLPSGEIRRVSWEGFASLGQLSNADHNLVVIGKAGRSRWLGIRPTVRGSAMNPVDHPYGGGEGAQPRGTRKPKDVWGNVTGGKRTRNKRKSSGQYIVKRRK